MTDLTSAIPTAPRPIHGLAVRASKVGQVLQALDWQATRLGAPMAWSPVLRTTVETVLNSSTPLMLAWGDELRMIYNDSYAEILEDKHPGALGQPFAEVWPEIWSELKPLFDQAMAGQPVHLTDLNLTLFRSGKLQQSWFDFALSPVWEAGRVGGVFCVITETTTARLLAHSLEQSERHLRAMSDAMPQMVFSCFPDGTSDYFNMRWTEFGGAGFPATTEGWQELIHPDDKQRVQDAWTASIKRGSAFDLEYRLRHRSGDYRWVLARAIPQFTRTKEVARWWGTCTDVDEQRRALEEQRLARLRIEATLLAVDVGTWVVDLKTHKVLSDVNLSRLHGVSTEHAEGEAVESFFLTMHPDDVAQVRQLYANSAETGDLFHAFFRVGRPEGGWRHLHARGKVELDDAGQPASLYGLAIDISQQMDAEEALRQVDRLKDEFLAMLSHELRNPLASISSAAELLSRMANDPERVSRLGMVLQRQVRHIAGLVEDLMDVSRVTRGEVTLESEPVDLVIAALDALEQVAPQAEAKGQKLSSSLLAESVVVRGDKKRLVQVFTNLLQNAVKFTPQGGTVNLALSLWENKGRLVVSDNGMGMTPDLLASVFKLFVQGQRPAHRQQGGLGLGLALARRLTELHAGTLTARSDGEGLGSVFEVLLPLAQQADEPFPALFRPAESTTAQVPAAPLRVLVVDDNVDAAEMLAMMLDESGYEVLLAHSALEAEQIARDQLPEACLLDIGLPDATGYELARRIRAIPPLSKVCLAALTGYGQECDRRAAFAASFDEHFAKPVELGVLIHWLANVPRTAVQ